MCCIMEHCEMIGIAIIFILLTYFLFFSNSDYEHLTSVKPTAKKPVTTAKTTAKPTVKTTTTAKPTVKTTTTAKPTIKTTAKPTVKPTIKTTAKPTTTSRPVSPTAAKTTVKSSSPTAAKTTVKPSSPTAAKTTVKPSSPTAAKTATKTLAKPGTKTATKTVAKSASTAKTTTTVVAPVVTQQVVAPVVINQDDSDDDNDNVSVLSGVSDLEYVSSESNDKIIKLNNRELAVMEEEIMDQLKNSIDKSIQLSYELHNKKLQSNIQNIKRINLGTGSETYITKENENVILNGNVLDLHLDNLCIGNSCLTKDKLQREWRRISNLVNDESNWIKFISDIKINPLILDYMTNKYFSMFSSKSTDYKIYQNIITAEASKVFAKSGNPSYDNTSFAKNLWKGFLILRIGANNEQPKNGISVTLPSGMTMLWIRVLNDRWETFNVMYAENNESIGSFSSGLRNLLNISPDGGIADGIKDNHKWVPIPVAKGGTVIVSSGANSDPWISGIAFSTNPWNFASNSAVTYHWNLNKGSGVNWQGVINGDQAATIVANTIGELYVPVVSNGKDKILFFINQNYPFKYFQLYVNDVLMTDRLSTSFDNPFATHYNSKLYSKYAGIKVSALIINPEDKFLKVKIVMTGMNDHFWFREIGTHDAISFSTVEESYIYELLKNDKNVRKVISPETESKDILIL